MLNSFFQKCISTTVSSSLCYLMTASFLNPNSSNVQDKSNIKEAYTAEAEILTICSTALALLTDRYYVNQNINSLSQF